MGNANAFLLQDRKELVLIDAGYPGREGAVLAAIRAAGRRPEQLRHIIFTHHHLDHVRSGAAIVRTTGATTYMLSLDIPAVETGALSGRCARRLAC